MFKKIAISMIQIDKVLETLGSNQDRNLPK